MVWLLLLFPNSAVNSAARIKIKGRNNIFFDVSDSDFQITQAQAGFDLSISPLEIIACPGSTIDILVNVISVEGFTGTVFLSAASSANFASQNFTASFVNTGESSTLSINIGNNLSVGSYEVIIKGNLGELEISKTASIKVIAPTPATVSLITPANEALEIANTPIFKWESAGDGVNYQLDISTEANFSSIIHTASNLESIEYSLPINLAAGQTYFWQVQSANKCGTGGTSSINSFTVTNNVCQVAENVAEISISSGLPSTSISPIILTQSGIISSIKVRVDIEHSWINDLTLTLESPSGKKAILLDKNMWQPRLNSTNF